VARIVDCLAFSDEAEREALRHALCQRAITVAEVLGREASFATAASALAEGFAAALSLTLIPGELSTWEQARSAELRETKYATAAWTERR
jgi:lipoate-protein ligase A